jgi:trimeric autotransporter adhesin
VPENLRGNVYEHRPARFTVAKTVRRGTATGEPSELSYNLSGCDVNMSNSTRLDLTRFQFQVRLGRGLTQKSGDARLDIFLCVSIKKTMNPLSHFKKTVLPFFVIIALSYSGFLPQGQAVSPPPDGCYPNFTTAEGCDALHFLTNGAGNTALGWRSLFFDNSGSFNTAVGAGTLLANTADNNTATGAGALLGNTTGVHNTANGVFSLTTNTVGADNTATGAFTLQNNTTGDFNTAIGVNALFLNTTGSNNTVTGVNALFHNTTGAGNSAFGTGALASNTASSNTAVGYQALLSNTTGVQNTAMGVDALSSNATGQNNTAVGDSALQVNLGDSNTAVGGQALQTNTTGTNNIALGFAAGFNVTTASNVICIGSVGQNVSGVCYIGNIFGATSVGGTAVFINAEGQLGTATSSRRFKEQIKPMEQASEALFTLKPVAFRYKKEIDPAGKSQLGLVAEDVEKVNPDLIVRDKQGRPYSVRYDQVNAMLLNEFLKEHRAFLEEQSKVEELEKQVAVLTAGLQKVSAQIELSKFATGRIRRGGPERKTVLNNR